VSTISYTYILVVGNISLSTTGTKVYDQPNSRVYAIESTTMGALSYQSNTWTLPVRVARRQRGWWRVCDRARAAEQHCSDEVQLLPRVELVLQVGVDAVLVRERSVRGAQSGVQLRDDDDGGRRAGRRVGGGLRELCAAPGALAGPVVPAATRASAAATVSSYRAVSASCTSVAWRYSYTTPSTQVQVLEMYFGFQPKADSRVFQLPAACTNALDGEGPAEVPQLPPRPLPPQRPA
jgi:hypothetical protein